MRRFLTILLAFTMLFTAVTGFAEESTASEKEAIEYALNLSNNPDQEWTYNASSDAWTLSVVMAVTKPVIENEEGVSVCVPGAYVKGIDTDGDGTADVTAETYTESVKGSLVIDYEAQVTSTNGQVYTAATAPVILNTGAAGYGNSSNTTAAATYATEGYINVACGNRGKQDSYTDENGNTVYTGDAPSCLVDQKAVARFVKFNILLGNLPGSVDYWVSTGGSGGGAHAAMFAATSNNPDFYDYQIEVGAVGVYKNADGTYATTVTIDGQEVELSDGAWGCVAYSAITSLYEADMAMAFEYTLDTDYTFNTDFQKTLAGYLSREYMDYINGQNLTVEEAKVGFDLDGDGELNSTVALTIEYDAEKYADTNGYGGTYLDLYLAEFVSNLQWYVDSLDYAEGWTWFDADALSDETVAAMTTADKAAAFIEGRYAKSSSGGMMGGPGGGMMGGPGSMMGGIQGGPGGTPPDGGMMGGFPGEASADTAQDSSFDLSSLLSMDGVSDLYAYLQTLGLESAIPSDASELAAWLQKLVDENTLTDDYAQTAANLIAMLAGTSEGTDEVPAEGEMPDGAFPTEGEGPDASSEGEASDRSFANSDVAANSAGDEMDVGTPDAGSTQATGSTVNSSNYSSYAEMVAAYAADIAEIEAGDVYGKNIVDLYNPLNYIGAEGTANPEWMRILCGASEGDISMFNSLNMQLKALNAGIDAVIEWQWDGGHVPSEILGDSLALYVDEMYGKYVDGAVTVTKPEAEKQTENGTSESASGTDLTSWVSMDEEGKVSFSLADASSYRTAGAAKACPGFDVIDYGQEDYVFGDSDTNARHWSVWVLKALQDNAETLEPLFNGTAGAETTTDTENENGFSVNVNYRDDTYGYGSMTLTVNGTLSDDGTEVASIDSVLYQGSDVTSYMTDEIKAELIVLVLEGLANGETASMESDGAAQGDMGNPPEGMGTPPDGMGGPGGGGFGGSTPPGGGTSDFTYTGATEIIEEAEVINQTFASETVDESALIINTDADVTISGITVSKTGDSNGGDNCNFYGLNAALLAMGGGTTTINGASITSDASGANGVFSYGGNGASNGADGDGTTVIISDSTITTTGNGSGGIMTTGGGVTYASNLTVETSGGSSAPIRTDRGGGTVVVDGGSYASNGLGSPAIYSTADITVKNATLVSNLSEGVCIEGMNSITLENCNMTANNTRCNGNATFLDTIMIYQSMSGDADSGTSSFTMIGGSLTSLSGHMFHITNTHAVITLNGAELVNEGSDVLLSVCDDGWSGASNIAELNAVGQRLSGTILVGDNSTLTLNLTEGSDFEGTFSGEIENSKGATVSTEIGTVNVTMDGTSAWTLTSDTYISSFEGDLNQVNTNGFTLYVNGEAAK